MPFIQILHQRRVSRLTCALLVAGITASGASAQQVIGLGETVNGSLTASDAVLADSSHFHEYTYRSRGGERVLVTLRSDEFSPFLVVGGFSGAECQTICRYAANSPGDPAQLRVTLNRSGAYVIRVNSYHGGATGAYTLELEPAAAPPYPGVRGQIQPGTRLESELEESDPTLDSDDSYYEDWILQPDFTGEVLVEMTSSEVGAFLHAGSGEGSRFVLLANSGGDEATAGGGEHAPKPAGRQPSVLDPRLKNLGAFISSTARVLLRVEAGRSYTFRANALLADDPGRYELSVVRILSIPEPEPDW